MSSNSTTLWYTNPAHAWFEALPVGNGRLGAMVFGGVRRERIQLNEETLWSGGPYAPADCSALQHLPQLRQLIFDGEYDAAEAYARDHFMAKPRRQASYQALGDLFLEMVDVDEFTPGSYRRALNLDSAEASVLFHSRGATYTRKVIANPTHQVIAVHVSAFKRFDFNLFAGSPQAHSQTRVEGDNLLVLSGQNGPENGVSGALKFEARFLVQVAGGSLRGSVDMIQVRDVTEATILIAMATSFRRYNDVGGDPAAITSEQLAVAQLISRDELQRDTAKAHQEIFRRVSLDLGEMRQSSLPTDERIAAFRAGADDPSLLALYFNFGRYLLITSSRPGTQPANLQGIWNDCTDPPWSSKYTVNINTEMNYWPAEPTNMPELVEPLVQLVRDIAETGKGTAKAMYGARGWVCHHNTDIWRATAPIDLPRYGLWPMGGAWLCIHLWDHYDYGRNKAFLRNVYPLMVGACEFFLDTLVQDPKTGFLVTCPSMSPENQHGQKGSQTSLCAGPTMDMQILRDLFSNTIRASEVLGGRDKELCNEIRAALQRMAPTGIGNNGCIREWQEDWVGPEKDHRHISHLYGLFPGYQISLDETPALARAAGKTLLSRGNPTTGWSAAWHLNCWSRLQDGEQAYKALRRLLSVEMSYPNLFDAHPPLSQAMAGSGVFQIDGNFGGSAGVAEMIVQSKPDQGEILLLPALPIAWRQGHLTGIRVRGGWTVNVWWEEGRLQRSVIEAGVEGTRVVRCGEFRREVTAKCDEKIVLGRGLELLEV